MRSCLTCRNSSIFRGRSCNPPARRAGSAADMALSEPTLPLAGITPHRTENYRSDHLLVAEMVERGSRVLDVGCGDGDLLQLPESRGIDGRGMRLSSAGRHRVVRK